jgi:hypothetical protein
MFQAIVRDDSLKHSFFNLDGAESFCIDCLAPFDIRNIA